MERLQPALRALAQAFDELGRSYAQAFQAIARQSRQAQIHVTLTVTDRTHGMRAAAEQTRIYTRGGVLGPPGSSNHGVGVRGPLGVRGGRALASLELRAERRERAERMMRARARRMLALSLAYPASFTAPFPDAVAEAERWQGY